LTSKSQSTGRKSTKHAKNQELLAISTAGYNNESYNKGYYGASGYRLNTDLGVGIKARVVKPYVTPPPIIDTLAYGLAQRFDWLQQAIQVFGLFGKIEYAKARDLDDHWGRVYDLPRLTGEPDVDYRARIQTYTKVLTGSGTILNAQEVLDHLIGMSGGTTISSIWPAKAQIEFKDVLTMRLARERISLIKSVLPGLFAAGVDYDLRFPFLDYNVRTVISGYEAREYTARAAVGSDLVQRCRIDALVASVMWLEIKIETAVQVNRELAFQVCTALRAHRVLESLQCAAVLGEPEFLLRSRAAVQGMKYCQRGAIMAESVIEYSQNAAIARNFELTCSVLARIVHMFNLNHRMVTSVRTNREQNTGIKARIARRD
jgi:hypothetical protein